MNQQVWRYLWYLCDDWIIFNDSKVPPATRSREILYFEQAQPFTFRNFLQRIRSKTNKATLLQKQPFDPADPPLTLIFAPGLQLNSTVDSSRIWSKQACDFVVAYQQGHLLMVMCPRSPHQSRGSHAFTLTGTVPENVPAFEVKAFKRHMFPPRGHESS